jgi:hypothetical protein
VGWFEGFCDCFAQRGDATINGVYRDEAICGSGATAKVEVGIVRWNAAVAFRKNGFFGADSQMIKWMISKRNETNK